MGKGVRVKNTVVSGGMSGHDAQLGKVFSHKQGANHSIMKRFAPAGNPNTTAQQLVRDTFAQTSAGWSLLSEAERNAWNSEAPNVVNTGVFGDRNQSGKNLYTATNVALAVAGLPAITSPGAKTLPIQLNTALLNWINSELIFQADNEEMYYLGKVQLLVSAPKSAGTSKCTSLVVLGNFAGDANISENILPAYTSKYRTPVTGEKIFYEVRLVGSGGFTFTFGKGFVIIG